MMARRAASQLPWVLLFCLLLLLLCTSAGAAPPVGRELTFEELSVSGSSIYADTTIRVNTTVSIAPSARLELHNVTLLLGTTMNPLEEAPLVIHQGGTLVLVDSTVQRLGAPATLEVAGALDVTAGVIDGTIHATGEAHISGDGLRLANATGPLLLLEGGTTSLRDATLFPDGGSGILQMDPAGLVLVESAISGRDEATLLDSRGGPLTLEQVIIEGGGVGAALQGSRSVSLSGLTIQASTQTGMSIGDSVHVRWDGGTVSDVPGTGITLERGAQLIASALAILDGGDGIRADGRQTTMDLTDLHFSRLWDALSVKDGSATLTDTSVQSSNWGVYVSNGSIAITRGVLQGNVKGLSLWYVHGATANGTQFLDNAEGASLTTSTLTLEGALLRNLQFDLVLSSSTATARDCAMSAPLSIDPTSELLRQWWVGLRVVSRSGSPVEDASISGAATEVGLPIALLPPARGSGSRVQLPLTSSATRDDGAHPWQWVITGSSSEGTGEVVVVPTRALEVTLILGSIDLWIDVNHTVLTPQPLRIGEQARLEVAIVSTTRLDEVVLVRLVFDDNSTYEGELLLSSSVLSTISFPFVVAPGPHTIVVLLDPDQRIAEDDEGNNRLEVPVWAVDTTAADLVLETLSGPTTVTVREAVEIRAVVRNSGSAEVEATHVRVQFYVGDTPFALRLSPTSLPANSTVGMTITYLATKVGTIEVRARVDPAQTLNETSETNNEAAISFTVRAAKEVGSNPFAGSGGLCLATSMVLISILLLTAVVLRSRRRRLAKEAATQAAAAPAPPPWTPPPPGAWAPYGYPPGPWGYYPSYPPYGGAHYPPYGHPPPWYRQGVAYPPYPPALPPGSAPPPSAPQGGPWGGGAPFPSRPCPSCGSPAAQFGPNGEGSCPGCNSRWGPSQP